MPRYIIGSDDRYIREIAGSPAGSTNPLNLGPFGAGNGFRSAATLDGKTIFIGGFYAANQADSCTLYRSTDSGQSFSEASSLLPAPLAYNTAALMGMYAVENLIFASVHGTGINDHIVVWDGSVWAIAHDIGATVRQAGAPWASAANDVYVPFHTNDRIYYYNGSAWALDGTLPLDGNDGGPLSVWGFDSSTVFVLLQSAVNNVKVLKGSFENWVEDKDFGFKAGRVFSQGRGMWGDSQGNLYVWLDSGVNHEVFKRTSAGVWSTAFTSAAITGLASIWGHSDTDIMIASQNYIARFNGTTWTAYNPDSLWGWGASEKSFALTSYFCENSAVTPSEPLYEGNFVINNLKRLPKEHSIGEYDCRVYIVPFSYNTPGKIIREREYAPSCSVG